MAATSEAVQTISRLTPLAEVLAALDREVVPVPPRDVEIAAPERIVGRVLAADALALAAHPTAPVAVRDGWAVRAEATHDAGTYAPAPLTQPPRRIDVGEKLPADTDAVAPLDAIVLRDNGAEALASVVAGDGVLPVGADCDAATPMRRAGERVRFADIAVFAAAGITHANIREPQVSLVSLREDSLIAAASDFIAGDVTRRGGLPDQQTYPGDFASAFQSKRGDTIVAIGGTGTGRNDRSVQVMARIGRVICHGIGLTPGETAAFGFVDNKPVLALPGRLDAALAVWLVIGRVLLARLGGREHLDPGFSAKLSRKVASTVGLAEFVPVGRDGDNVMPLAAKYLPLSALARADGWILVPAESEGYPAGAEVQVRPWP